MSDLKLPNSNLGNPEPVSENPGVPYNPPAILPAGVNRTVVDKGDVSLEQKALGDRAPGEVSQKNEAAFRAKQQEIIQTIVTVLAADMELFSLFADQDQLEGLKLKVDGMKAALVSPESKVKFSTCIASLKSLPPQDQFSLEEFIMGLSGYAVKIFTDEYPGREIYLNALESGAISYESLARIMHSPNFPIFHIVIFNELPIIAKSLLADGLFSIEELWSFYNVELAKVDASGKQSFVESAEFKVYAERLGIDLPPKFRSAKMTSLHLMAAGFMKDFKIMSNWIELKAQLVSQLKVYKGSKVSIDKIVELLMPYKDMVETCRLLDQKPTE